MKSMLRNLNGKCKQDFFKTEEIQGVFRSRVFEIEPKNGEFSLVEGTGTLQLDVHQEKFGFQIKQIMVDQ